MSNPLKIKFKCGLLVHAFQPYNFRNQVNAGLLRVQIKQKKSAIMLPILQQI